MGSVNKWLLTHYPHTPCQDTRYALYARPSSHSTSCRWICPSSGASDQQGLHSRADGIGLLIYSTWPRFTRLARFGWVTHGKAAVRFTGHAWVARSRGQSMFLIRPRASDAGCQCRCTPLCLSTQYSMVESAFPHARPRLFWSSNPGSV